MKTTALDRYLFVFSAILLAGACSTEPEINNGKPGVEDGALSDLSDLQSSSKDMGENPDGASKNDVKADPPIATNFLPVEGALGVLRDGLDISADFSKKMNKTTLVKENVMLSNIFGEEAIDLVYEEGNRRLVITPLSSLAILSEYEVTLTPMISDISGLSLPETAWSFTTDDGDWEAEIKIVELDGGDVISPSIDMDGDGNGIALWAQSDGTRDNIWANRYENSAWGSAVLLETGDKNAFSPRVVFDPEGNATAIWLQGDNVRTNIWTNRFTKNQGWGEATMVESSDTVNYNVNFAFTKGGEGLLVWDRSHGGHFDLWSSQYTKESGWAAPKAIDRNHSRTKISDLAMDNQGNGIALWLENDGLRDNIWASVFEKNKGWGSPTMIEVEDGKVYEPKVAFDREGNAISVWYQSNGMLRRDIWSNRYSKGRGWGVAEKVEENAEDATAVKLSVDGRGRVVAIWVQGSQQHDELWSARFTRSSGWGEVQRIGFGGGEIRHPVLACDPEGNAIVVWYSLEGRIFSAWSNRFTNTGGWQDAQLLENQDGNVRGVYVEMNPKGKAITLWTEEKAGIYNLQSRIFN